ncbi:hypothetical protein PybrP1_002095 [[Pythium] brassicae (nom. inval.)]|nr:hypothetical protein PybrP1_002095 [[Pythium] brassicae (nom. inval.)]
MRVMRLWLPAAIAAFLFASVSRAQQARGGPAYRRAAARANAAPDGFSEVTFSSTEDDFMRSKKRDTADTLAGYLPGKSVAQVARRCVELGLPCGDAVARPERGAESWRTPPARHQPRQ